MYRNTSAEPHCGQEISSLRVRILLLRRSRRSGRRALAGAAGPRPKLSLDRAGEGGPKEKSGIVERALGHGHSKAFFTFA